MDLKPIKFEFMYVKCLFLISVCFVRYVRFFRFVRCVRFVRFVPKDSPELKKKQERTWKKRTKRTVTLEG